MFRKKIKKYWTIIQITWQRALVYRATVFSYRIGEVAEMLIIIFMWTAIFRGQTLIGGYTLQEMVTYVLFGNLVEVIVRNWLQDVVSGDIRDGTLSQFLVRPIEYFDYIVTREVGRNSFAFFMSVLSQVIVVLFFLNKFVFNFELSRILLIIIMIIFAFVIEMFVSYLIGMLAFWTNETIGIYTTIGRLKKFLSGGYFPLNLLPAIFVNVSFLLPFAYSFFVPAQIYLGKMSLMTGIKGLGVQIVWIFVLYGIIQIVWKKGLKKYEGVGI